MNLIHKASHGRTSHCASVHAGSDHRQEPLTEQLRSVLGKRSAAGLRRSLALPQLKSRCDRIDGGWDCTHDDISIDCSDGVIDFTSNDYLGYARSPDLHARVLKAINDAPQPTPSTPALGSTGSRLLSGNSRTARDLEQQLSEFHGAEAAVLFNSGYDANVGLFSTLPQPHSFVIYDELIHASVHDGVRQCRTSNVSSFRHNDLSHLREKLLAAIDAIEGSQYPCAGVIVAVESIYSMDGDEAPLVEIVNLIKELFDPRRTEGLVSLTTLGGKPTPRAGGAYLVVDEAHSTGVRGWQGRGLVHQLGLQNDVFARLHTFGKAVGAHGAVVFGSQVLIDYLINYARPLIYSTSLPLHSLFAIRASYEHMQKTSDQKNLSNLIRFFHATFNTATLPPGVAVLPSNSPIQGIVIPGNIRVTAVSRHLMSRGIDCRPIRSPTVPAGAERLRICLHAHNSESHVKLLEQEILVALRSLDAPIASQLAKL